MTTERPPNGRSPEAERGPAATPPLPPDVDAVAPARRPSIRPAAALKRHIDWLEYALGAARAEEAVRAGRLETATKKNRAKRTSRLADVRDEVQELDALLRGIRDLQDRARPRTTAARPTPAKPKTKSTDAPNAASASPRRRVTTGSSTGG